MPEVNSSIALDRPEPIRGTDGASLEQIGLLAMVGVSGALQFSIAVAQILFALAVVCWIGVLIWRRERFEAPAFFWPLLAYAGWTLVSAAFSFDPRASFIDSKQLVLILIVPVVFRFVSGTKGFTMMTVIVTCAAISAAFGIFQYGILHYDHLGQRPQGTLSHWMTYSGLLMLVFAIALARVLFGRGERTWAALVIPALVVAVAVTFTRGAMIGLCASAALLFALKDFRLFALAPVVAAIFVAVAPGQISERFASIFDRKNPTNMDRVAMIGEGRRMIAAHPLTGVGPNMVQRLYTQYRGSDAVNAINPHLHNVPLHTAAERGLPALAIWIWFIVAVAGDVWRRFGAAYNQFLPAAGMACLVALLVAGLFEYNFGDSEVLMLFLIVITLPAAARNAINVHP